MDGRRPYELLAELKESFRQLETSSPDMLRKAFIRAMPDKIKSVLVAAAKYTPIDGLVEIADNMLSNPSEATVSAVELPEASSSPRNTLDSIQQQIEDLRMEVMHISSGSSFGQHKRRNLCYYHSKFGNRAYKCVSPCDWKENPPKQLRPRRGNWRQEN